MTGHIFIAPASSDVTCVKNLFVIKMTSADNSNNFILSPCLRINIICTIDDMM